MMLEKLQSLLQEAPPAMAFEISEAGIAAARIGSRAELDFLPLKPGTLSVSPLKENVLDAGEFGAAVRSLAGSQSARKRRDVALILPDFSARISVLDFDSFPKEEKEQASLIRFRLKRSVPFDVETAAMSYWAQSGEKGKTDVVVVMAPLEIISRYESPFRTAGMNPGMVTTSCLAALELAPEAGLSVLAKLTGRVLTVVVRDKIQLKLVRCLELPSAELEDIAAVLVPTFVYIEDNLGRRAEKLLLCGFGAATAAAESRFAEELTVDVEALRSPLGTPGENNAGLLGYLRSIAKNN
jgi:type IV pilus assembly protein PilM